MLLSSSTSSFRTIGVLVILCGLLFITFSRRQPPPPTWRAIDREEDVPADSILSEDAFCRLYSDPGNIAIAVKTGATEAEARIPAIMHTSLRCAKNVMIFSDMEQDIAGYHLHDSLKDIPEEIMANNPDFDLYRKLNNHTASGHKVKRDPHNDAELAAWTLDKYKQLHILEALYAAHPDKDWYIMIDADTFLIWPNVLTWTKHLPNPRRKKLYMGSKAQVEDDKFAHGGSGIFMSHAALHNFAVEHAGAAARWDEQMREECCGDYVIGLEMMKNGVKFRQAWPTTTGERIVTTPFGPNHWCQPVATLHHMSPEEMEQVAAMLRRRQDMEIPIIYAELFNHLVRGTIPDMRDWWDNVSQDYEDIDAESFEDCKNLCVLDQECFQFSFHAGKCALGYSVKLGDVKEPEEDGEIWQSGWLVDRIYAWTESQPTCSISFPWT